MERNDEKHRRMDTAQQQDVSAQPTQSLRQATLEAIEAQEQAQQRHPAKRPASTFTMPSSQTLPDISKTPPKDAAITAAIAVILK